MKKYILSNNKLRIALLLTLQTFRTLGTVGIALVINHLIDAIASAISTENLTSLIPSLLFSFVYAALLGLIIFISERYKTTTTRHIMLCLRHGVVKGLLNKSIPDFQSTNSAEYITLLNQNINTLEENYLHMLLSIYESIISILIASLMLIYINPIIAIISIVAMAIPSFIPKFFGTKLACCQSAVMQGSTNYNATIKDILNGFEVINAYKIAAPIQQKHSVAAIELENSKARYGNTMAKLYGLANMCSVFVQFLIMLLSGGFAVYGFISLGSIIAITQLTGQVISPAFQLSSKISQISSTVPIREQLETLISDDSHSSDQTNLVPLESSLQLQNISGPNPETPIVRCLSATFEAGKKYAIVGKSGSGKSTLLKLLAGFYDTYSGNMIVDMQHYNTPCNLSLISQNVFLFDDTIRNNITLYKDYTQEELNRAVNLAGLDDVIAGLESGIDTPVMENGSRFSGGEKQRIAIARALLHNKKLLLLDEATSSLDNETAAKIEQNILDLTGVTCISVTHRLSSELLQKYDGIYLMDHGEIIDCGSYNELIQHSDSFIALYSSNIA